MVTKLSYYFTLEEFLASQEAVRRGIANTPTADDLARLKQTALRMDAVRIFLGNPVIVSSGYRTPALNTAIGGADGSDHTKGLAIDFICPGRGSVADVFLALKYSGLEYDQLINEFGKWVHIGFGPRMRNQCLRAVKSNGKTVYEVA